VPHSSNTTTTLPYLWYHWVTALIKEYPMSHVCALICRVDDPTTLTQIATKTMIVDWYHLHQKCLELSSRICRGKQAKRWLLLRQIRLWRGDLAAAIALLEAYRPQSRKTEALDTFSACLQAREDWMVNYGERRIDQHSIGSGMPPSFELSHQIVGDLFLGLTDRAPHAQARIGI
jgi:hypothetical protein